MLVRRIARPLLAATFVSEGINGFRDPAPRVAQAQRAGLSDAASLVRAHAAVTTLGGLALATGRFPRLSAAVLAAALAPASAVRHPFWSENDKDVRRNQQLHFTKDLGLLGGLILAAVDLEGREALPKRAVKKASRSAERAAHRAEVAAIKAEHRAARRLHALTDALPG